MNNAEIIDGGMTAMPLSDTRDEVSNISNLFQHYNFDDAIKNVKDKMEPSRVKHILLIGSGDSYALALLYAARYNYLLGLPVKTSQSWEFIKENSQYLDETWLVIVLSASGRPSPVVDALIKAQQSTAQVIGISNTGTSFFSVRAQMLITTGATKSGMPTQSTIGAALCLDTIGCCLSGYYRQQWKAESERLRHFFHYQPSISRVSWIRQFVRQLSSHKVTILGSGEDFGLAMLFSNLLWCGPQIPNQVLLLEEYQHALRLNQASVGDLVVIFECTDNTTVLTEQITQKLTSKKVPVRYINHELLSMITGENKIPFSSEENCRYYAMMLIFNLIISSTEYYLSCGGYRVSLE
ncbi:TPA: SIS domain-containing protein [Klebsiella variicola]|nr:SIS domain-containing protein [Klebsiella variicola]